ncbi:MAG: GTP-binding protein, partial [Candidatus Hodarchaeota archaeon]
VGKTTLKERFMGKVFKTDYIGTIGADIAFVTTTIGQEEIAFQIWDIAGQPGYETIRHQYYQGSIGSLLVYDVANAQSFENAKSWLNELWINTGKGKVPVVLIANKIDLRKSFPAAITFEQGQSLARELSSTTEELGFEIPYIETSAKTGENVRRAFSVLGKNVINYMQTSLSSS